MLATSAKRSLRTDTTPSGGVMIRSKVALISAEVSGEPSWNRTPSWRVKV
jgi:hypothetical protein